MMNTIKLDDARTLAIQLYEAGQKEKRRQPKGIWGYDSRRNWRDLPSESMAVWDAIAICAYQQLRRHNSKVRSGNKKSARQ